jgi:hypothetical protein
MRTSRPASSEARSATAGVRVAFIVENGAPIELLEFTDPNHPARGQTHILPK